MNKDMAAAQGLDNIHVYLKEANIEMQSKESETEMQQQQQQMI